MNLKEIKDKVNNWGNKTDPEGLTNYDGIIMFLFVIIGLSL